MGILLVDLRENTFPSGEDHAAAADGVFRSRSVLPLGCLYLILSKVLYLKTSGVRTDLCWCLLLRLSFQYA